MSRYTRAAILGNPHAEHWAGAANSVGCVHGGGGRLPPGDHSDSICVGNLNLQPDLVLVSRSLKRIGLLDLCRPFDSHSELRAAARQQKVRTYGPRLAALRSYLKSGWQVLIPPWVVGFRGMVDAKSVLEILDFLRVSRQLRAKIRRWKK